jgi:hypothetical protein
MLNRYAAIAHCQAGSTEHIPTVYAIPPFSQRSEEGATDT